MYTTNTHNALTNVLTSYFCMLSLWCALLENARLLEVYSFLRLQMGTLCSLN